MCVFVLMYVSVKAIVFYLWRVCTSLNIIEAVYVLMLCICEIVYVCMFIGMYAYICARRLRLHIRECMRRECGCMFVFVFAVPLLMVTPAFT